jgi:methyl-accepting chemotaxis protein
MMLTVDKTKNESDTIIGATLEVNSIIKETAANFQSMIGDFEETNIQLQNISDSIENLSLSNSKVEEIISLSHDVSTTMTSSRDTVQGLTEITEKMQEKVSLYQTGQGAFDQVISQIRKHRDYIQQTLQNLKQRGINVFDNNYRPIPNTNPQKFNSQYTEAIVNELQSHCDEILKEIPNCIYAIPVDRNGYVSVHHSQFSRPLTGNLERDIAQSRDRRIYFTTDMEKRRVTNTTSMLMQTYMRETGEVLSEIDMPITIDGKNWGGFAVGFKPELFT